MKKSLVAIAALTLVGAASAQVTLTGNVSFSYQSSLAGNGLAGSTAKSGLAMSDNSIFLGDTEDLGGGTKLVMSTGFDAGGRNGTGGGNFGQENSSLAVSGGFGSFAVKSFESDGAFAAVEGLANTSLDVGMFDANVVNNAKRFRNGVFYSAPAFSGVTLGVSYVTLAGQYASTDSTSSKTKTGISADYAAGALKLHFDDAFFNASYPGNGSGTTDSNGGSTQPTLTAIYDFGVASVGAGWTKQSVADAATTIFALNVPVGALTFGLASSQYNGTVNGNAFYNEESVSYNLSKRTVIKASFGQINDAAAANATNWGGAGGPNNAVYGTTGNLVSNTQTRVGLFHSF